MRWLCTGLPKIKEWVFHMFRMYVYEMTTKQITVWLLVWSTSMKKFTWLNSISQGVKQNDRLGLPYNKIKNCTLIEKVNVGAVIIRY